MTDLQDISQFRFWSNDTVRFADIDRYGHVNNVAFAVYAETGRVEFAEVIAPGSADGRGVGWVIARSNINYRNQAHYPGLIRIGTAVEKIGRSSVVLKQGLFCNDVFCADTESVIVWIDVEAGLALPLPEAVRDALKPYMLKSSLGA